MSATCCSSSMDDAQVFIGLFYFLFTLILSTYMIQLLEIILVWNIIQWIIQYYAYQRPIDYTLEYNNQIIKQLRTNTQSADHINISNVSKPKRWAEFSGYEDMWFGLFEGLEKMRLLSSAFVRIGSNFEDVELVRKAPHVASTRITTSWNHELYIKSLPVRCTVIRRRRCYDQNTMKRDIICRRSMSRASHISLVVHTMPVSQCQPSYSHSNVPTIFSA